MTYQRFTVAAVTCSLLAACGGDAEGNNDDGPTNNAVTNNSSNNTSSNNTSSNNVSSNNATTGTNSGTASTNNLNPNNLVAGPDIAALAATADFMTSSSAWHRLDVQSTVTADATSFGSGDLGVSLGESWAFVLDRNSAQVQVLDPATGLTNLGVIDVSGVSTTNPHAATDVGGTAYVSLYNAGEVAIATPDGADWNVSRLSLAAFDDYDQNPEPAALLNDEGYVLVILQQLQDFVGVENSSLLVVDAGTNQVVDVDAAAEGDQALDLQHRNVQVFRRFGAVFAFGATGDYGVNDGGIVALDRTAAGDYAVGAMIVSEEELGGDLIDFAFVSDTSGFAVITLPDFSSQLLHFTTSGDVTAVPTVVAPGFGGLDVSADGRWLGVGDRDAAGLTFKAIDLMDTTFATSYDLSPELPPAAIRFLP